MELFQGIAVGTAYVLLAIIALVLAKALRQVCSKHIIDAELTEADNHAQGAAMTGYYAGIIIIFLGATVGEVDSEAITSELLFDIGIDLLYVLAGILALNLGRLVLDHVVLRDFSIQKEILEDRNTGTGAVVAGTYLATAFVLAGSIYGTGGGPITALVTFFLGQALLAVSAILYRKLAGYDVHAEIERDNVAAGLAMGLNTCAFGIVLFGATSSEFALGEDGGLLWADFLEDFFYYSVFGLVLLSLVRRASDVLLLPRSSIKHEIATDRNLNAAWIEGGVAIGMATVVVFMI